MQAHERAAQIWSLLCLAAMNRQILTYKVVGGLIGVPNYALAQLLEPIKSYCLLNKLPALTVLVVDYEGRPGTGFIATENVPAEQQRVFRHDWQEEATPLPQALLSAVQQLPSCGVPGAAGPSQRRTRRCSSRLITLLGFMTQTGLKRDSSKTGMSESRLRAAFRKSS